MSFHLTLPMPPSVNALYFNAKPNQAGRGRRKTGVYQRWIVEAGLKIELLRPKPTPVMGDIVVSYTFGPRSRRSDVFNREKAVSDLLVSHGLIADDRYIVHGTVEWSEDVEGVSIFVRAAP